MELEIEIHLSQPIVCSITKANKAVIDVLLSLLICIYCRHYCKQPLELTKQNKTK